MEWPSEGLSHAQVNCGVRGQNAPDASFCLMQDANLIGSAVHRPLELRTSVRPSNFAPIAAKLRENAFRTIRNFRFFDAGKFFWENFSHFFFSFFRDFRPILEELGIF